MAATAVFPTVSRSAGLYESFYMRAVAPDRPLGVWIRYTVHKRPGQDPRGSLWFTLFDREAGRPLQQKLTTTSLAAPHGDWIDIGEARMGPAAIEGGCGGVSWSLAVRSREPELRHLTPRWLYRAPLPRTKLTSPCPSATFDGTLRIPGRDPVSVEGWPGMVGHNWGSEHAERWIWLHGTAFAGHPEAWLDVALGRVRLAGRLTPWLANGALSVAGRRYRIGGLFSSRELSVHERPDGCRLQLAGGDLRVQADVRVPGETAAGWRYADPDGGEHDVINCSIAELDLGVVMPGEGAVTLRTAAGGAYELGMREHGHGVPIAPFADG